MVCRTDEKLSLQEIKERVNLPDEDIVRILHSMSCAKYKLLAKQPNNKTINKNDTFTFNAAFTDRMRRIKVRASHSPCMHACQCVANREAGQQVGSC